MDNNKLLIEIAEIAAKLIYYKEENKRLTEENLRLLNIIANLTDKR